MLQVPVYDMSGSKTGSVEIDAEILGGKVRPPLLKQAVVIYQANQRQGTSATKSRGMVSGSTRKLYRQKGTGNARMGAIRTVVRRGGGVAFAKGKQNHSRTLPVKMRRLARNNAILAKIVSQNAVVVEGLTFETPKTKTMAQLLSGVGASRGCVVALGEPDANVVKSARNIPKTEIKLLRELNAYEILCRKSLVLTKPAFEALVADPVTCRPSNGGSSE
ncbi:MAG: 50S ribosomal protein L4 [Phycisphaerae bacterium]